MPELPEVETLRRQLAPRLTGATFVAVTTHHAPRYANAAAAAGDTVTSVHRRGKYLLCELASGRELLVHLGMTGQLWWDDQPADHVKATFVTDRGTLFFRDPRGFGRCDVVTAGSYAAHPTLASLGPDPLEAGFDLDVAAARLATGSGPVKARLLAQRAFAGSGNYLCDEALWRARLHPAATSIDQVTARVVVGHVVDVMHESLDAGAMSERDYQHLDGSTGTYQHVLAAYGRYGQACLRCGATLQRCTVAGRTSTFCPTCQPA